MNYYDVLLVEDDPDLSEALEAGLEQANLTVITSSSAEDACKVLSSNSVGIVVSDIGLPNASGLQLLKILRQNFAQLPMILMTAYGEVQQAVQALKMGASDYLAKPFTIESLIEKVIKLQKAPINDDDLAFNPGKRHRYIELAKTVAESDCAVLLRGESGTGKEVVSRYIHNHSSRKAKPFVAINCAAIPENMLESTLFGFEKGAFTGAYAARVGKFEQADGGTLLLDEISEMDIGLQAKLLRVIQENEVERLGAKEAKPVNVRIIATTNRDLADEVAAGRFRQDLYFRLNVFPVVIPPLRHRRDDLAHLASHFLTKYGSNAQLTDDAMQWLLEQNWPGNIRELENLIQRVTILCREPLVDHTALQAAFDIDARLASPQQFDVEADNGSQQEGIDKEVAHGN